MSFSLSPWRYRLRASAMHLLVCALVAALSAMLVFGVWYPSPFASISGGRDLFILIVVIDVVLGPAITFVIFSPKKPKREIVRDVFLVAVIQICALSYGMWTVFVARPVHLVFEIYRFNVVHAIEIDEALISQTPAGIRALPFTGPTMLAVRPFRDDVEREIVTMAALQGASLASRPDLWRPYSEASQDVLREARPVTELLTKFAAQSEMINDALNELGRDSRNVVYVPLIARRSFWTVFLDPITADVLTIIPLDSF